MRNILTLILLFLLTSVSARAENPEDYVPFKHKFRYTYKGRFEGQSDTVSIISMIVKKNNVELMYFIEEKDLNAKDAIIGINMIGYGAYVRKPGAIYTIDAFWKRNLETPGDNKEMLMLKTPLSPGSIFTLNPEDTGGTRTITVAGFEDVSVPAGKFLKALKITYQDVWPNETYNGTAWFAKSVGMVKRIHGTGRIDELSSYGPAQ